ncbi:MAG: carbonic anhydrase [Stackebrandtia sp.]
MTRDNTDAAGDRTQEPDDAKAERLRDVTSAEAILRMLLDGNQRFVNAKPRHRRDIHAARAAAAEQHPLAAVFTCVDSRVTVESLFDCDFGQLIVVRTAGHVADRAAVGSLEFAVDEFDVPLVVVLGHERCGAIATALDVIADDPQTVTGGSAAYLADRLRPPATKALKTRPRDASSAAVRFQVEDTVAALRERLEEDMEQDVVVVGACYDLDAGTVQIVVR